MATWITLQISDLYDYLCAAQLNVLKNLELAPGQANPLDEIIGNVTVRIRAEISGNRYNPLSADKRKIPQDLKSFACHLVLESAQTRLPSLKLTADQIRMANDARDYLRRIAHGEIPISIPDEPLLYNDFAVGGGCSIIHSRIHDVSGKSLSGF